MANTPNSQREQRWRQAIAGWMKSGLSIRAYCSRHHLSEPSFYAWRRELAKRDRSQTPAPKFLPLQLRAEPILEVALPNGLIVRSPAGVEAATVAALVAALRATPC
jgi:hypothetical protein